jgi:hypothetical protein
METNRTASNSVNWSRNSAAELRLFGTVGHTVVAFVGFLLGVRVGRGQKNPGTATSVHDGGKLDDRRQAKGPGHSEFSYQPQHDQIADRVNNMGSGELAKTGRQCPTFGRGRREQNY